jgi:choline monooxygenase
MNKHEHEKFDKTKSNLKEVRSSVWLDLIMVNISNNEVSFEEYIKPLEDRWSEFWTKEDQRLIHHAHDYGYFLLEVKCNWKFAIENYCESYHLPWVHPGLNAYSKIDDHYHIQGLPNRFAGQGTVVYNPRFEGGKEFPTFPGWSKEKEQHAEYVALFPNVMLGIHKDHYYAYWLEPVSHNYTKEHMEIYYVGEESATSEKYKNLRRQNYEQWHSIQSEDLMIIEGMQEGRNSPIYNGGNFSPVMDNPTHHFNKWVATNLVDN